jgi:hypothetical protein
MARREIPSFLPSLAFIPKHEPKLKYMHALETITPIHALETITPIHALETMNVRCHVVITFYDIASCNVVMLLKFDVESMYKFCFFEFDQCMCLHIDRIRRIKTKQYGVL